MDKARTCFFTGHRRIAKRNIDILRKCLDGSIERMITENGVDTFINGGAIGFDAEAAESVLRMKKKYPGIKLVMYIPCYGQSKMWGANEQYRYRMILSKADDVHYVTEGEYDDECMRRRNLSMIKNSSFCIAYCIMRRSGTGFTVRNAENVGINVENLADYVYE